MKPMCNHSERRTSFYKFLCDHDFTSRLRLPPQFVKNHGKNLSEKAKLRAESGDSWIVRTERIGDHFFFTDGWMKFAQDADLKFREFLLFKFVGNSTFEVSVYGISGCLKELHSCPRTHEQADDNTQGDQVPRTRDFNIKAESENEFDIDQTPGSGDGEIWSFVKELTKDHTSELDIPRDFAVDTGIVRNRKLKLRDAKGKKWPIYVTPKKHSKFAMTAGWNEFLLGSKIVVGSTISFEFVSSSGNIIEAKVLRKGTDDELFSSAKKGRGRPPKLQD